jgi:hypothetical protein
MADVVARRRVSIDVESRFPDAVVGVAKVVTTFGEHCQQWCSDQGDHYRDERRVWLEVGP